MYSSSNVSTDTSQPVELDVLLVVLEHGLTGEDKLLLAFLPVEGLLFKLGESLPVVLFLLVEFVDDDFGVPILAVGFQQGKLRLFQTALMPLAAVRGGLLQEYEFSGGIPQGNDDVWKARRTCVARRNRN